MRPSLRPRLTYANVTATLALFVALAGGAYAATALPANSIGAKQLKKNAVEDARIKKSAVDSSKVKDSSLTASDTKNGSLTGADINLSSLGTVPSATNSTNATNATHAASAAAIDRAIVRTAAGTANATVAAQTASCDAGYRPVSGGARVADSSVAYLIDSYPELGGWTARVQTTGPRARSRLRDLRACWHRRLTRRRPYLDAPMQSGRPAATSRGPAQPLVIEPLMVPSITNASSSPAGARPSVGRTRLR